MEISKANLSTNGQHLNLAVPFSKFDVENRIVSGFATADNLDRGNDIVLAEASSKAFERFRGNIREMHDKIAVGRMVSFSQQEVYDPNTEKFYNAIYVSCYISKGAENTWEKILDGTLSAFSIGGEIKSAEPFVDPETEKTVRIIKEYDLVELSIVDSPMNQLSNVMSIVKSEDGFIKGMVADTDTSNVFWCNSDSIAKVSNEDSLDCACGQAMQNIGWIESSDVNKADSIKGIIKKFLGSEDAFIKTNEGGTKMADTELTEVTEEVAEVAETPEVEVADEAAEVAETEDSVEKTVEVSEVDDDASEAEGDEAAGTDEAAEETVPEDVPADAEDVEKSDNIDSVADLKAFIESSISEIAEKSASAINALEAKIDEISKQFNETVSGVTSKVDDVSGKVNNLTDAVAKVDSVTAVKKSDDLGGSEAVTKKDNIWGGSFLDIASL